MNAALPQLPLKATDLLLKEESLRMWIGTFKIPSFPVPYLIIHKKRAEKCLISLRGVEKTLFQMYNETSLQKEQLSDGKGLLGLLIAQVNFQGVGFTRGGRREGGSLLENIISELCFLLGQNREGEADSGPQLMQWI